MLREGEKMEIFISYSSKDIQFIKRVCEILKKYNITYWVAYENCKYGENYADTIINAITEAEIVLAFISKSSNNSTHVINEINSAVMRDKMIIPVMIDNSNLSPTMEYYLASNHYISYMDTEDFEVHLLNRITTLLSQDREEIQICPSQDIYLEYKQLIKEVESGNVDSMCELGRRYYNGLYGANKNLQEAFSLFMKAAKLGSSAAQCNVAWCYEVGDGVEASLERAFEWYMRSAQNGCSMAQYSLGWMYANGISVAKNQTKAIEWFQKAAAQGQALAQYKLGIAYLEGVAVDKDNKKANQWLMLAADQGVVFAQHQLANNYYFGCGCERDIIKAKKMWLLAAERGFQKSAEALEKYYDIYYMDKNKGFLI